MPGLIYQLNCKHQITGERGIPKYPIESARITFQGLEGDYNRYRTEKKQNRREAALMLLPLETILQLNQENWPIEPGHLGENITTQGIAYDSFAVGKIYQVGLAEIQITEPCTPCTNLYVLPYVGREKVLEFNKVLCPSKSQNRRGWYAKVLKEGMAQKGDNIEEIQ